MHPESFCGSGPAREGGVFDTPLKHRAGFIVLSGNFFDSAIMKVPVVDEAFRKTYLSEPGAENSFEARTIVLEGPEDYHARIEVDLNTRTVNLLIDDEEMTQRRREWTPNAPPSQTPWQELYRQRVGQLSTGGCLEPATLQLRVIARSGEPRHSH